MALLWSKTVGRTHYEVRNAGASLRLYSNGIFHSQWNPKRPFSGQLWDLLCLPAFFNHESRVGNVLILGVGGGAAINAIQYCFNCTLIRGVDLDHTHLYLAKRFFISDEYAKKVELIHEEARHFMSKNRKKFDYIVEDLFIENPTCAGDARRAIELDTNWLSQLADALKPQGILVSNFENQNQFEKFMRKNKKAKLYFGQVYTLQSPRYENVIAAFLKHKSSIKTFENHIKQRFGERKQRHILEPFIIEEC